MSLTICPVLCLLYPWLIQSIRVSLYLPPSFTHFAHSPGPLPSGNHQFVFISLMLHWMCLSICFFRFHIWVKSYGICLSLTYFPDSNSESVSGAALEFTDFSHQEGFIWGINCPHQDQPSPGGFLVDLPDKGAECREAQMQPLEGAKWTRVIAGHIPAWTGAEKLCNRWPLEGCDCINGETVHPGSGNTQRAWDAGSERTAWLGGSLTHSCWTLSAIATRRRLENASSRSVSAPGSQAGRSPPAASPGWALLWEFSEGKRELSRHCGFSGQLVTKYALSAYYVPNSVPCTGTTAVIRDKVPTPPPPPPRGCILQER